MLFCWENYLNIRRDKECLCWKVVIRKHRDLKKALVFGVLFVH
jgi:hypothetical protein